MGLQVLHRLGRRDPLAETLNCGSSRPCQGGRERVRFVAEAID